MCPPNLEIPAGVDGEALAEVDCFSWVPNNQLSPQAIPRVGFPSRKRMIPSMRCVRVNGGTSGDYVFSLGADMVVGRFKHSESKNT